MRLTTLSILILVFLTACNSKPEVSNKELPNLILISVDDMGWSDLGCYGSEVSTPNIDKLAHQGMRFTQFHNTSKCFPSRACLLTGVYAQQNGYDQSFNGPLKNSVTLGEVLREAGYITLWSGKHHGLENPIYRGFDHYYGLKDGACNHFNPGEQRPGEGVPARKETDGKKRNRAWCIDSTMFAPYTPEAKDFYTTDYFTHYAVDWLKQYEGDKRPLFLYMSYTAPHDPLMAWPEDIAKYEGNYNEGYEAVRQSRYARQLEMGLIDDTYALSPPTYPDWESLSAEEKASEIRKMEVYAAMIDRLDQNIGRLLLSLEETGRRENTLIILVSDNGASAEMVYLEDDYGEIGSMTLWSSLGGGWANVSNTPFRYYKNNSYEGGINTPLIANWQGKLEPGGISRFPGHFIDIMATYVDLCGSGYPDAFNGEAITPMQGVSLLPAFKGYKSPRQKPLFWEWKEGQAVRDGEWKLVKLRKQDPWDLFYVAEDPTETTNLATEYPDKVKEMDQQFLQWKVATSSPANLP